MHITKINKNNQTRQRLKKPYTFEGLAEEGRRKRTREGDGGQHGSFVLVLLLVALAACWLPRPSTQVANVSRAGKTEGGRGKGITAGI